MGSMPTTWSSGAVELEEKRSLTIDAHSTQFLRPRSIIRQRVLSRHELTSYPSVLQLLGSYD